MGGEARPDRRRRVPVGPIDQFREHVPVRFVAQSAGARLHPAHDEAVEPRVPQPADLGVVGEQAPARELTAPDLRQREQPHPHLRLAGRRSEQPDELALGQLEGGVGHVVDDADLDRPVASRGIGRRAAHPVEQVEASSRRALFQHHRHRRYSKLSGRSFRRDHCPMRRLRRSERLIEIRDDVVDVLDADAQPDRLRPHARHGLLLRRHLAMGGGGRMAGERLRVADVDEALDELERVVEPGSGLVAALDPEGQQRAGAAAEIFLGERVIGVVGETRHN